MPYDPQLNKPPASPDWSLFKSAIKDAHHEYQRWVNAVTDSDEQKKYCLTQPYLGNKSEAGFIEQLVDDVQGCRKQPLKLQLPSAVIFVNNFLKLVLPNGKKFEELLCKHLSSVENLQLTGLIDKKVAEYMSPSMSRSLCI